MTDNSTMNQTVKEVIDGIRSMADSKTVVGEPININGLTTIIPVSKVTVGVGLGGRDSLKEKYKSGNTAGATGLTVVPVAFLVVNSLGETRLLNVGENTGYDALGILSTVNSVDKALDKAPDILKKIKAVFAKDKQGENNAPDAENTDSENTDGETAL